MKIEKKENKQHHKNYHNIVMLFVGFVSMYFFLQCVGACKKSIYSEK